jgi:hypothetical protein
MATTFQKRKLHARNSAMHYTFFRLRNRAGCLPLKFVRLTPKTASKTFGTSSKIISNTRQPTDILNTNAANNRAKFYPKQLMKPCLQISTTIRKLNTV